jgi:hypothetical protein
MLVMDLPFWPPNSSGIDPCWMVIGCVTLEPFLILQGPEIFESVELWILLLNSVNAMEVLLTSCHRYDQRQ